MLATLAFGFQLIAAIPVLASGFAVNEQGAKASALGAAFTASADDPSAIFYNPAGIAFLEGTQVYFGGSMLAPTIDFTGVNPFPGEGVSESVKTQLSFPSTAYLSAALSERVTLGLGAFYPFRFSTEWREAESFSGRFISTDAELRQMALNGVAAYRLADRLAVAGGLDLRFSSLKLERFVPAFNPFTNRPVDVAALALRSKTATGLGYSVGVLARFSDAFSAGFSYRHRVKTEFSGEAGFERLSTGNAQLDALMLTQIPSSPVAFESRLTTPALWSVGLAYRRSERFRAEFNLNRALWSSVDALPLDFQDDRFDTERPLAYADSYSYRGGVEFRPGAQLALRGGFFFDESPVPAPAVSVILPDGDRRGFSLGVAVRSGRLTVDVYEMAIFVEDRATEGVNLDGYEGSYRSFTNLLGVSLGISF